MRIQNTDFTFLFFGSRPPPRQQQETLSRKKRPQRQLLDTFSEDTVGCPSLESTRIQSSATAVKNPLASPPPPGGLPVPSTKTPVTSTKTPEPSTKTPEQLENDRLFDALLGEALGLSFLISRFAGKASL
jgi:hypothetical protein